MSHHAYDTHEIISRCTIFHCGGRWHNMVDIDTTGSPGPTYKRRFSFFLNKMTKRYILEKLSFDKIDLSGTNTINHCRLRHWHYDRLVLLSRNESSFSKITLEGRGGYVLSLTVYVRNKIKLLVLLWANKIWSTFFVLCFVEKHY